MVLTVSETTVQLLDDSDLQAVAASEQESPECAADAEAGSEARQAIPERPLVMNGWSGGTVVSPSFRFLLTTMINQIQLSWNGQSFHNSIVENRYWNVVFFFFRTRRVVIQHVSIHYPRTNGLTLSVWLTFSSRRV